MNARLFVCGRSFQGSSSCRACRGHLRIYSGLEDVDGQGKPGQDS